MWTPGVASTWACASVDPLSEGKGEDHPCCRRESRGDLMQSRRLEVSRRRRCRGDWSCRGDLLSGSFWFVDYDSYLRVTVLVLKFKAMING